MIYIIKVDPLRMPKFSNYTTFKEEFDKYMRTCKKKMWRTLEGFSLEFDTPLSDLRDCIFIKPTKEEEEIIQKHYKVLEII